MWVEGCYGWIKGGLYNDGSLMKWIEIGEKQRKLIDSWNWNGLRIGYWMGNG